MAQISNLHEVFDESMIKNLHLEDLSMYEEREEPDWNEVYNEDFYWDQDEYSRPDESEPIDPGENLCSGDLIKDQIYFLYVEWHSDYGCSGYYHPVTSSFIYSVIHKEVMEWDDPTNEIDFNGKEFSRWVRPDVDDIERCYPNNQGRIIYRTYGYFHTADYLILFKAK